MSDYDIAPTLDPGELRLALARHDPGAVELRETHISWVFLVGERAYKLKKPLVLPFVDYGTAARRQQLCHEEVRLNRRLAPSIYLGVLGIARTTGSGVELCADEDPRAIDYVVEMRRYDEDRTLAATLRRRELSDAQVAEVAQALADFHQGCRRVDAGDYGASSVEREVERNVAELLAVTERRRDRGTIRALARFMVAFGNSRWGELDARAVAGCVRECHGDLRAEHVVLETPVSVVDCVEFDASLRTLDVADDLAFLVMDLAALGGERFHRPLVDAYRAAGGEPGDDSLLAFFAVHRALVRAKVLRVRAAQHPVGSSAHQRAGSEAQALLNLAETLSWRARRPLAIVFCGVPASGKSYLASEIATRSALPLLRSDLIRKQLAGRSPTQAAAPEHYSDGFSHATYAQLGDRAAAAIRQGGGVLVDATFRRRGDRDVFVHAFADVAPLLFVECRAPADVLIERARVREGDPDRISDATVEVVTRERDSWEPLDEVTSARHMTLRTDRPVDGIASDLVALLDQRLTADNGENTARGEPGHAGW